MDVAESSKGGVEDTRLEAKAEDTKKIRGRGQRQPFRGQTLSRPRTKNTSASVFQKKKMCSQKFFRRSPKKKKKKKKNKVYTKIFQALHKILAIQKLVLSSSRGRANFRGLEASRPRPRTSKCVLEDSTSVSRNV